MNFKTKLSTRIGMEDIYEIGYLTQGKDARKQELFDLIFDEDEYVAYQATWAMTHFSLGENRWLYSKQDKLIDELMQCTHNGKKRVLLSLIYRQPMANPPRVDFLDFCLESMISASEPHAVQATCMKIAYELCRPIPELSQELRITLETMERDLSPAMSATKKNILKAMVKGKSLQII